MPILDWKEARRASLQKGASGMAELNGSLEDFKLSEIIRLLNGLRKSGSLAISRGDLTAEILLTAGAVADASFRSETGLPALEAAMLALPQGQFAFTSGRPAAARTIELTTEELLAHLDGFAARQAELVGAIPALDAIPRLGQSISSVRGVSLDREMIDALREIDGERTVEDIAVNGTLAGTLLALARLRRSGLVTFDPAGADEAPAASSEDRAPDRVLLVEDDPDTVDLFKEILSEAGYEVSTSDSTLGASKLVRQLQPCAVLLDLGLPYRPGSALLGELKADPETAGIPVVVVSGLTEALTEERRALATAVITKPVDADTLLDAVQSACSPRRN